MIRYFDNFIFEAYGVNDYVKTITNGVFDLINDNLGKLILNGKVIIYDKLSDFSDINFYNDTLTIVLSEKNYSYINFDKINIVDNKIHNCEIYIEFNLSKSEKILKKLDINNSVKININHELQHIIELYLIGVNKEKSEEVYSKSWDIGKQLHQLKNKYTNSVVLQEILYLMYLSLPHEMRSRVSSMYEKIKQSNIKDIDKLLLFVKNTKEYQDCEFLSNLNIQILINQLKKDEHYLDFIKDFNNIIGEEVNNLKQFRKYFINIKSKNEKMKRKLEKSTYNFLGENKKYVDFGYGDDTEREIDYTKYQ